jgi:hypothetical protein
MSESLERIKELLAQLPDWLESDHEGTHHYEVHGKDDPWWLDLGEYMNLKCPDGRWVWETDQAKNVGLALDAVACMATDVRALVAGHDTLKARVAELEAILAEMRTERAELDGNPERSAVLIMRDQRNEARAESAMIVRYNEVLRENVAKLKARVADLETVWYEPDAAPFIIDVYLTLERGGKRWVATGYKLNRSSVWYDADSERPLPEGVDGVAWAHIRKPAPMEAKP